MTSTYVPACPSPGDFIWLTFDPHAGREQAGRRPALVLSPKAYNQRSGLALVCPVTSQAKGYPFVACMRPRFSSASKASGQPAEAT